MPPSGGLCGSDTKTWDQLVRVFIHDGTYCPAFPFLPDGQLQPIVTALFRRAMEIGIPHNYFTVWMITPSREFSGTSPVDHLKDDPAPLFRALGSYRWR
jgi:hypothetical protein